MRLKSPTEKPIHVALLSGHAITIGPEGRDVPVMFRREAFANGALPEGVDEADLDRDVPDAGPDRNERLKAVIKEMLESGDEDALTGAGIPNRRKVSALAGWSVSVKELTAAWHEIEAEAKAGEE